MSQGSVTQFLNHPRLAIFVGASPGGFPNADLSWVEVITDATSPTPTIHLSPATLVFTTEEGSNPVSQGISLSNSSGGTMTWTAAADAAAPAWLSVSPASGTDAATIAVSVNSASLTAGTYTKSITVSAPGSTNTPQTVNVTLTVNAAPPALSSLSISPTSILGGNTSLGMVTLSGSAPSGGLVVSLSSNDSAASIPPSVTVPTGNSSAIFTITTSSVSVPTAVTLSASYNGGSRNAVLTVNPAPASIALTPASLTFTAVEGITPANQIISLTNSGSGSLEWTATADATAPAWLNVSPANGNGNATLTASVNTTGLVPGTYTKNITISATGATNTPQFVGVTLTITAVPVTLSAFAVNPMSTQGGSTSQGMVTLSSAAPSGGVVVSLSSDNASIAGVPASVTVPGGSTSATFTITTIPVASSMVVTISAVYNGVTRTTTLTVNPPTLSSISAIRPVL